MNPAIPNDLWWFMRWLKETTGPGVIIVVSGMAFKIAETGTKECAMYTTLSYFAVRKLVVVI